jgi:hypothetical protein
MNVSRPDTAQPGAAAPAAVAAELAPLSYIRCINQFNALENEAFFSDSARGLFQRILYHFNKSRQWEASLPVNVPLLQLLTGSSPNTIIKALAELQRRGVVHYVEAPRGRGKTGLLRLLKIHRIKPAADDVKPSNFDGIDDGFVDDFTEPTEVKPSTKPSKSDDTIRGVRDVTTEGPPAEKKMGVDDSQNPDASAPHTGGGAAAGPAADGLRPAREDDPVPPPFIDHRLSDDDPRKWEAIPKDAAMVDEYLAGHPDPQISKHAGSGHLFFDYYEGVGFRVNGRQMRNWRAVARGYSFIDYKALRAAEHAARQASQKGGQLDKRSAGVSEAERILEQMRKEAAAGG